MAEILIFTDGSSRGNPGPGGYGIVMMYQNKRKELSAAYRKTTNNRMELMAVIIALEAIKNKNIPIHIYSDSKYVIDSITKRWVWNWRLKGYKGKKNQDLWERFIKVQEGLLITYHWVKGHAGHVENERCDVLATVAADNGPYKVDDFFENSEEALF